jgi:hypothetical protein
MVAWKKVEPPPAGHFVGWGVKPTQHVTGEVLSYDETGGSDFGGKSCPQLEIELTERAASFNKKLERTNFEPGEVVLVTCGLYELKRMVLAAEPERGDLIKIVLDGTEDLEGGNTVKRFSMQIAKGGGKSRGKGNVRVVEEIDSAPAEPPPDDDDIPF